MACFVLQLAVTVKVAKMVACKGVTENIRYPVGESGQVPQVTPMPLPLWWANATGGRSAACQQALQWRIYSDQSGSAGFAVLGQDGDAAPL